MEFHLDNIIGKSKALRDVLNLVKKVANTQATVLISGASGTVMPGPKRPDCVARADLWPICLTGGTCVRWNCFSTGSFAWTNHRNLTLENSTRGWLGS